MDPRKVLILNQTFEPLQVCTARRAIILLFTGKAERVEDSGGVIRSPSACFALPLVIRLLHFIAKPVHTAISFNKKNILKRDAYTCQYCGRNSGERMTIDHVVPKAQGGRTIWENVVSACRACNLRKGNRRPGEAGMHLLRKPTRPHSFSYLGILAHASPQYQAWRKYLPREVEGPVSAPR
jgi:5-methylcytosine-specific restriction endonuclease McrA